jgi:hypothetical protein
LGGAHSNLTHVIQTLLAKNTQMIWLIKDFEVKNDEE